LVIRAINSSTCLSIGGRPVRRCVRDPSNLRATKQACREWLDNATATALLAPNYCPNSDIFFELQFDHGGLQACVKLRGGSSRLRTCC